MSIWKKNEKRDHTLIGKKYYKYVQIINIINLCHWINSFKMYNYNYNCDLNIIIFYKNVYIYISKLSIDTHFND